MFMQRLITSLVLIPLVLLVLFYGPIGLLASLVGIVLLIMGNECCHLIPLKRPVTRVGFLLLLVLGLWLCGPLFFYWQCYGLLLWLGIFTAILSFPRSQYYWGHVPIVAILCLSVVPLALQSLIHLYFLPKGQALIVYLLCLVWAADIGAYLAGKQWGVHKMIPQVSPGKSWEGALGGLALVLLVAAIAFVYFQPAQPLLWFVLALIIMIVSVFGDLFVSILKRRCHLKDTGALIPGHGGLLDRLDSLIAALPFFYVGVNIYQ